MNFSEGRQGGCGRTPRSPPKSATDWLLTRVLATWWCLRAEYVESLGCYVTVVQRLASYLRLCRELYDHRPSRHQAYQYACSAATNDSRHAVAYVPKTLECRTSRRIPCDTINSLGDVLATQPVCWLGSLILKERNPRQQKQNNPKQNGTSNTIRYEMLF